MTSSKYAVFTIAAVLFIVGLSFGFTGVTAGPNAYEPMQCGSLFAADDTDAEFQDSVDYYSTGDLSMSANVDACEEARAERQVPAYGGIGLGVVALVGGLLAPGPRPRGK